MDANLQRLLDEQRAYYRARAWTYDDWWLRVGRYDEGEGRNADWFAEIAALETWLRAQGPLGHVVELAAGTGLWTRHLAGQASSVLAIDASAETLALNRARGLPGHVAYAQADIFDLVPVVGDRRFDTVFFGFWLSHVPHRLFARFWAIVAERLRPGGRALFVDSAGASTVWRFDDAVDDAGDRIQTRDLDGAIHRVVKQPLAPDALAARLAALGWTAHLGVTDRHFIHGVCRPPA